MTASYTKERPEKRLADRARLDESQIKSLDRLGVALELLATGANLVRSVKF